MSTISLVSAVKKTIVLLVFVISYPISASDQFPEQSFRDNCFTYPAVAMSQGHESQYEQLIKKTHNRVYHADGKIGTIILYGPVGHFKLTGRKLTLRVSFKDSDGSNDQASVKGELRFVGNSGFGAEEGIWRPIKIDSNSSSLANDFAQATFGEMKRSDFEKLVAGYWMVSLYISRSALSEKAVVYGYSLCSE